MNSLSPITILPDSLYVMSPNRIYVWRFEEAPEEYRRLSDNGGDEDWLVLVPSHVANDNWIIPQTGHGPRSKLPAT